MPANQDYRDFINATMAPLTEQYDVQGNATVLEAITEFWQRWQALALQRSTTT